VPHSSKSSQADLTDLHGVRKLGESGGRRRPWILAFAHQAARRRNASLILISRPEAFSKNWNDVRSLRLDEKPMTAAGLPVTAGGFPQRRR
jgi:hypothetical protein